MTHFDNRTGDLYMSILSNLKSSKKIREEVYISIIVFVFNAQKYLSRCLDSILNQTFNNIEIIVIDDSSSDVVSDTVFRYRNSINGIKNISYVKNDIAIGKVWSYVKALRYCNGKYVHFLDSGDIILEERYAKIYEYLKYRYEAVYFTSRRNSNNCDVEHLEGNYTLRGKRSAFNDTFFNYASSFRLSSYLFLRRRAIEGAMNLPRESLNVLGDNLLTLFILFYVRSIKVFSDPLYYFDPVDSNLFDYYDMKNIYSDKLSNYIEEACIFYNSLSYFLKRNGVWAMYRTEWSLYISMDLEVRFIKPLKSLESYMESLYIRDKSRYAEESKLFFEGYARVSNILMFLETSLKTSVDFSEKKLFRGGLFSRLYRFAYRLFHGKGFVEDRFINSRNGLDLYHKK